MSLIPTKMAEYSVTFNEHLEMDTESYKLLDSIP